MVSVIVNVYNCKDYLPTSLESVRQQTYQNLEVILVDDCSTDGSGEFCDEYCKRDERFRVIHHEKNTGVSGPRNTGLKNAQGDYIYFLDGDDYMHAEMIERLHTAILETGIGLAACDYIRTDSMTNNIHQLIPNSRYELVPTERVIFEMLAYVDLRWCVVWNKLYKRELINGLLLNDYYSIQDQDFNLRVYLRLKSLVFVPNPLYWYYSNPNSLQRDSSYYAKRFYLNTKYRFKMLDYLSKNGSDKKYRAWIICYGYFQMLERREIEKGTEYEYAFKNLSEDILIRTRWEFILARCFPVKKKLRFFVNWYCPKVYEAYAMIR